MDGEMEEVSDAGEVQSSSWCYFCDNLTMFFCVENRLKLKLTEWGERVGEEQNRVGELGKNCCVPITVGGPHLPLSIPRSELIVCQS